MSTMFCRGCGKEMNDSLPMCPYCGAPRMKTPSVTPKTPISLVGVTGYLLGPFCPFAGIITGLYLVLTREKKHGVAIIALSFIWILIMIFIILVLNYK